VRKAREELTTAESKARQLTRAVMTPLEKHKEKLAEVQKLYKKGLISAITYNRTVAKMTAEMEKQATKQPEMPEPPKARVLEQVNFKQIALNRISLRGLVGFRQPKRRQQVEARGVETRLDTLIGLQRQRQVPVAVLAE
jgi:hypothetical protein